MTDMKQKRALLAAVNTLVKSSGANMPAYALAVNAMGDLLSAWTGQSVKLDISAAGQTESVQATKAPIHKFN